MRGSVVNPVMLHSPGISFSYIFFFYSNGGVFKVAGDCRPTGKALCVCWADGEGVGSSEAARHCDQHSF